MQINHSEIKDLTSVITLVVEPADYNEEVEKQIRQVRQKAQFPGFRPGMVPKNLVKKMYGKGILADVINKLIGEKLGAYCEEQKLQILGDPMPNEELTPEVDFDTMDTFTFAFDIAVAPEFDAKLTGKDKLTEYEIEVTDEMVNKQVESYQERFGEYVDAQEYHEGDMLRGMLLEEKEENPIQKEGAVLSPAYMKDKKEQKKFDGAKEGDEIIFNPKKAYENEVEISSMLGISKEEAAALESNFKLKVESITTHVKAELNGELFAKVFGGKEIADEAQFRAEIKKEIEENMAEDAEYKFGIDVKAAVMKKMEKVAFPEAFLKKWVKTTNENLTDEELDRDFPKMVEELKWHLAKDQLMKHFNLNVEKNEVEDYAKKVAKMQFMQYGMMHVEDQYLTNFAQEMLKKEDQLRGIVERVAENKVYAALKGVAKVEKKAISHEDFGKLFA